MQKNSIVIKEGQLLRLIYEAIASKRKTDQINFVTGGVGEINFTEYFDIDPRGVKRAFLRNGGDKVTSFLGISLPRLNFNILYRLSSRNLSVKEYHKCDCGELEFWMFFSESKSYGDKSFYMMVTLNSNGRKFNGREIKNAKASHFIMTSRLSSESIGIAMVDLLVEIFHEVSGFNLKPLGVGSPLKRGKGYF